MGREKQVQEETQDQGNKEIMERGKQGICFGHHRSETECEWLSNFWKKQTTICGGFNGKSTNSCVACTGCLTLNSWQFKSSDGAGQNKSVSMSSFSHSIQVLFSECLTICCASTAAVCACHVCSVC